MVARRTTGLRTTDNKTAGVKRRVISYLLSVIGYRENGVRDHRITDHGRQDRGRRFTD